MVHTLHCLLIFGGLRLEDSDGLVTDHGNMFLGWVAFNAKGDAGFGGDGSSIDETKVEFTGEDAFDGRHDN